MGRGRGNSPRSILLGPRPRAAVLPVEPAEMEIPKTFLESTIADFRFNFFSCAQCAKSENRCRCSNPNLETNNQLSPEFLNEIYNINDTLKTGWSSRPKVTIPAGVRIAHFEDKTYTPREENYREKYRDLMKTTQRRSSTGRYQFEIIESRKVWQKPVLTWWSGNNKKVSTSKTSI